MERDKWVNFTESLLITGKYIPYTVELKKRNGKTYAFVSFNGDIPQVLITKERGVTGIDINASPFHVAYAEVKEDGNLKSCERIHLNELTGKSKGEREILSWKVAHQIVKLAKEKEKAIVIEVNPAFTSVIGQLKYAPQYSIDKDVAGAFVTGRRGMGYREEIPENYLKLLEKEKYLEYSLYRLREKS